MSDTGAVSEFYELADAISSAPSDDRLALLLARARERYVGERRVHLERLVAVRRAALHGRVH
jgi:hypothetical protein